MIMSENLGKMTPFMKLFCEQQKQFTKNKSATSNRYHPMIIRFCLSLASKSASAYDELRSSNVLTLPSGKTLPQAGFNPAVIQELIKTTELFTGHQRNIVLSFDEMKIQEILVYDMYSADLVGYVDLRDLDLKFELGYLATKGTKQS